MNTNDAIALHIIKQDMKRKGISDYELQDHVIVNPTLIEISPNQAAYVLYFSTSKIPDDEFIIKLNSVTDSINYTQENTISTSYRFSDLVYQGNYESSQITKHYGNIKIANEEEQPFLLRYIKVIFNTLCDK